jgi:hypothetical protein
MTIRWLFVDEHGEERRHYASLLTEPGTLEVTPVEPRPNVSFLQEVVEKGAFDGLLLDHVLNDATPEVAYAGSTLAAFARSELPGVPVVALSARLRTGEERRRFLRTEELFDHTLDKQDVQVDPAAARARLKVLSEGYRALAELLSDRSLDNDALGHAVLGLSDSVDEEGERALVARILVEEHVRESARIARFLLHVALRLQGPLLDRRRAAAASGIDPDWQEGVDDFIAIAAYRGVFASFFPEGRYWREEVGSLEWGPQSFPTARCTVCGEEAYELCEVCEKPVDGIHSLPVVRSGVANDVFLRGRVCGICLAGEVPEGLVIESRYAGLREPLVSESEGLQRSRDQTD